MLKNIDFSIVIPLFNEEDVIPLLLQEINRVSASLPKNYEVILVDDGSTDNTFELIKKAAEWDSKIKVVKLSRNFGHQAAFSVGIDFAQGDMVLTMDGDLQHPPSLIPTFIKYAEEGNDVVIGERLNNKQNSKLREIFSKREEKFAFSELVKGKEKDKVSVFVPLLHLDSQHRVLLEQEGHLDEIWIWLKSLHEKKNAALLEIMRKEVEAEIEKADLELSDEEKERAEELENEFKSPLKDL